MSPLENTARGRGGETPCHHICAKPSSLKGQTCIGAFIGGKQTNNQTKSPKTHYKKKPQTTKQQVLLGTWKAFSVGKGDAVIHIRHHLANLPDRLSWGTIYPLPNFVCVQCTLVLSSLSAQLPPALPMTNS